MLKTINQRISFILLLIAVGYLVYSYQLPKFPYTPVDADVVPKGLGYLLIVLSVALYFSEDKESEEQRKNRNIPKKEWYVLLVVFLLIIFYIFLFEIVGFIILTTLYIFICSWLLGYKNHVVNGLTAVGFSVFIYVVFVFLLNIYLPKGVLPI